MMCVSSLPIRWFVCVMLTVLLAACATGPTTKTYVCRNLTKQQYCVQTGDSLNRIAQRFQVNVADLKAWNHLRGDVIHPGQVLTVASKNQNKLKLNTTNADGKLQWPVHGKVVSSYGEKNKGIDIAAPRGTLVYAAADGTVMYSGNDIKGYGNLLLIQHSNNMVTAYANNDNLLVPNKAKVKAGQIVAAVGDSERSDGRTALHFEVRVNGKHVNPMLYLKNN